MSTDYKVGDWVKHYYTDEVGKITEIDKDDDFTPLSVSYFNSEDDICWECEQDISLVKPLRIYYINYKDEGNFRNIIPLKTVYRYSEWHSVGKDPTWLMIAWDLDKDAEREFKLEDIKSIGL